MNSSFKGTLSRNWNVHLRRARAGIRDTWLLLREFASPLLVFSIAVIGGGCIYYLLAGQAGEPLDNIPGAIYHVLTLTFIQASGDFPKTWYLEAFYFIMPIIGVIILAQGLTEFGVMLFNRRARSKEWEKAVASTYHNHIVLIGLGHLGYRVARHLHEMEQDVVVVEHNPKAALVANAKGMNITVIQEDASQERSLITAGVERARTIVLCTQDDSLNLKIALKARRLKPEIHVVLRIFEDDFAQSLEEQFGFTAFSATGMAAPAFAAAAAGMDMTRPITVEGEVMSLGRLKITPSSPLVNIKIGELEQRYNVSVVFMKHDTQSDMHPSAEATIAVNDTLAILGGPAEISALAKANWL